MKREKSKHCHCLIFLLLHARSILSCVSEGHHRYLPEREQAMHFFKASLKQDISKADYSAFN